LGYYLQSPDFQEQLRSRQGETDMAPYVSLTNQRTLTIAMRPLTEQRHIAGVLGVLDDLVEVNRKLVSHLLSCADAVAESRSVTGGKRTFGEVCEVSGGGTPSTKTREYWNGQILWATPTDITALPSPYLFDTARRITQAGLGACSSKLVPAGTILMTSRATIGSFAVTQEPTAVNQGFIAVEPKNEVDRWFLFHEMRRRVPEFIRRSNGSTFLELSRGVFKSLPLNWPDEATRTELFERLDPIHKAAAALEVEIAQLAQARDQLLPLLMSGRVRVGEVAA
jgi:type I restriction enzyme S subunit